MKKRALVSAIVLAAALVPARASAWGFTAHRYIMGRAIELLPPELKTFFDHYRDEIVVRAIDPDLWRNVGSDEDPHHFMNFGARELGDYPFTALPREYGAAIEKFGMAALRRNGMLPWRAQELFGDLRRTLPNSSCARHGSMPSRVSAARPNFSSAAPYSRGSAANGYSPNSRAPKLMK